MAREPLWLHDLNPEVLRAFKTVHTACTTALAAASFDGSSLAALDWIRQGIEYLSQQPETIEIRHKRPEFDPLGKSST